MSGVELTTESVPSTAAAQEVGPDPSTVVVPPLGLAAPRPPRRSPALRLLAAVAPGLIALVVFFGTWEIFVRAKHISRIELVAPSTVFREWFGHFGFYLSNAWVTLQEAFWGFLAALIVATALAVLISHSRVAERAASPVITILQVTPVLVLAAPLVLFMGFGPGPKITIAALITFVPFVINATTGFRSVDPATVELLRSVNASRREVFFKLRLPNSLPYLVAATKICVGLALVGATVAEFSAGSSAGIGYVIVQAGNALAVEKVWAAIFTLTAMGVIGVSLATFLGNRLLRWSR